MDLSPKRSEWPWDKMIRRLCSFMEILIVPVMARNYPSHCAGCATGGRRWRRRMAIKHPLQSSLARISLSSVCLSLLPVSQSVEDAKGKSLAHVMLCSKKDQGNSSNISSSTLYSLSSICLSFKESSKLTKSASLIMYVFYYFTLHLYFASSHGCLPVYDELLGLRDCCELHWWTLLNLSNKGKV